MPIPPCADHLDVVDPVLAVQKLVLLSDKCGKDIRGFHCVGRFPVTWTPDMACPPPTASSCPEGGGTTTPRYRIYLKSSDCAPPGIVFDSHDYLVALATIQTLEARVEKLECQLKHYYKSCLVSGCLPPSVAAYISSSSDDRSDSECRERRYPCAEPDCDTRGPRRRRRRRGHLRNKIASPCSAKHPVLPSKAYIPFCAPSMPRYRYGRGGGTGRPNTEAAIPPPPSPTYHAKEKINVY
jgi:hypothetical protein